MSRNMSAAWPLRTEMSDMYKAYLKRILDFVTALCAIVILSPLLLILTLTVKLDSRGPVLFRQKRVGIHKTYFNIYKFRTMRPDAPPDLPTHLLNYSDKYITRSGRVLRRTSLDELPQLFNVLAGQMSFVGPRPALWNQYDLIAERDRYGANDILPGMTGWAQVNGRDILSIRDKARLDGEYAAHLSFGLDFRCFFMTFRPVLRGEGVVEGGKEPAEERDGENRS